MNETTSMQHSIEQRLKRLKPLVIRLVEASDNGTRLKILNQLEEVKNISTEQPMLKHFLLNCSEEEELIIKSLWILGQGSHIFKGLQGLSDPEKDLKELLERLTVVEKFYDKIGGIIGYHQMILQLILEKDSISKQPPRIKETYLKPPGYDLTNQTPFVDMAIRKGLESMELFVEIYPVGGAGDRLNLQDEKTGEDLPSAQLIFQTKTLLEGLIRDLQAREYLYFKLFDKQICVPIAMMTSDEKNNFKHVLAICEEHQWFGRPQESYEFFKQPLVPVLTEQGEWIVFEHLTLMFKPGGHGVLWKLLADSGILESFLNKGHSKALIRQINNPIAATDYGLLAFSGCGLQEQHTFGFASCPRLLNTAEGMNVLIERDKMKGYDYCISNIEYPDFVKKNIEDIPETKGSLYSAFPANTNILFADLLSIKEAIKKCAIPGLLINMKSKVSYQSAEGEKTEAFAGRLESLMQNIADVITNHFSERQKSIQVGQLKTFLTYSARQKTISVTKKLHAEGSPMVETPEGCYYDVLKNHYDLFSHYCQIEMPSLNSEEDYLKGGPSFITYFHPSLGPLYAVIAQKIRGGRLGKGSEMHLEIAEVDFQQIEVEGSFLLYAENIIGHKDVKGVICYSDQIGRCHLKNVKIINKGIDRKKTSHYWKGFIHHQECLKIVLRGCSEFIAENVIFKGNLELEVPDGYRMIASMQAGEVVFRQEEIGKNSLYWKYTFNDQNKISLLRNA